MELIKKKIIKILSKTKPIKVKKQLLDKYNYFENGHVDSLNFIKFIFELEHTFKITFKKNEINSTKFKNILGLAKIINNKKLNHKNEK